MLHHLWAVISVSMNFNPSKFGVNFSSSNEAVREFTNLSLGLQVKLQPPGMVEEEIAATVEATTADAMRE